MLRSLPGDREPPPNAGQGAGDVPVLKNNQRKSNGRCDGGFFEPSPLRIIPYLNVSFPGIFAVSAAVTVGECADLRLFDPRECVRVIEANRDLIAGVKVRGAPALVDGQNPVLLPGRFVVAGSRGGLVQAPTLPVRLRGRIEDKGCNRQVIGTPGLTCEGRHHRGILEHLLQGMLPCVSKARSL
jgi:hypothetical protein